MHKYFAPSFAFICFQHTDEISPRENIIPNTESHKLIFIYAGNTEKKNDK